jgi:hypothetical protein
MTETLRRGDAPPVWHARAEQVGHVPGELIDGDDDGFYDKPSHGALRGLIIALPLAIALWALILWGIAAAFAQAIPSVPLTGPQARDAVYGSETVPAPKADAIVRQQSLDYLKRVVASMLPQAPAGMRTGVVVGLSMNPGCDGGVYVAGWVVEKATRVDLTVDGTAPVSVTPTATMTGYPKSWAWCVPVKWQDGKVHRVYARAMQGTTLIGPIDNATALNRWSFTIPSGVPPPVVQPPAPTPAPTFTYGRVSYVMGTVTVEVAPRFTKVELLIDSRDVSPWYQGAKTVIDGKATFVLPVAARDGAEHLLDVRLYDPAVAGVFRPDYYPVRAVLAP